MQFRTLVRNVLLKSRHVFLYGLLLAILVFALKWLQWKFLIADHSLEIYIGLVAVLFTALGVWVAMQLTKSRDGAAGTETPANLEVPSEGTVDQAELEKLGLTRREYEVLKLLSQGQPNAEIAANLFLSVSTVKTHLSNLFVKMNVKNRAQAVAEARRLRLVP